MGNGLEIERKFLVDTAWQPRSVGVEYCQGYLSSHPERTVRVRIAGDHATLTIKGVTTGITRREFEFAVPLPDARAMLSLCEQPLIEKRRYVEQLGASVWEIDVFGGANAGLVVAEIELASPDAAFERPAWLGREVSDDPRYYNSNLIRHPYTQWSADQPR